MADASRGATKVGAGRAAFRKEAAERELQRLSPNARANVKPPRSKPLSVLRVLFELGSKLRTIDPAHRARAIAVMASKLEEDQGPLKPAHFNLGGWHEVAELIVRHFEAMPGLSATSLRNFLRAETRKGHESALGGLLFHYFVRANKNLWIDLRDTSQHSVAGLNAYLKQPKVVRQPGKEPPSARLVNSRGEPVEDSGTFSTNIRRGYDVVMVLRKKGTSGDSADDTFEQQATDDVLFTTARRKGGEYTLFTAEVETKTAGAAGGFGKQLSEAQARYGDVDLISIRFQTDSGVRELAAGDLVFDLHDDTRFAVSAFSQERWRELMRVAPDAPLKDRIEKFSEARLQGTAKGGYYRRTPSGRLRWLSFYFPRLDLAVESAGFARLSRVAMSAMER